MSKLRDVVVADLGIRSRTDSTELAAVNGDLDRVWHGNSLVVRMTDEIPRHTRY